MASDPIVVWVKGGVAYRQLQLDHESVNNLGEFAPEVQMGIGYRINEQATFNVSYQTVLGKQPVLIVNLQTETGAFYSIPKEQAIMIGVSFNFR